MTAAAAIMVAAFSGFVVGSLLGLQEFGWGLAVAIAIDATVIRALLVPALMAIMGEWNWYLPDWAARVARISPAATGAVRERRLTDCRACCCWCPPSSKPA